MLAIYAIISSLAQLQSAFLLVSTLSNFVAGRASVPIWQLPVSFSPFAAYVATGVILWRYADELAVAMSGNKEDDAIANRLNVVEILTIAFCLPGLWTALSALPRVTQSASILFLAGSALDSMVRNNNSSIVSLLSGCMQVAIGAKLFFSARKLADRIAAHYRLSQPVAEELS